VGKAHHLPFEYFSQTAVSAMNKKLKQEEPTSEIFDVKKMFLQV
jgi:hypothetical protein